MPVTGRPEHIGELLLDVHEHVDAFCRWLAAAGLAAWFAVAAGLAAAGGDRRMAARPWGRSRMDGPGAIDQSDVEIDGWQTAGEGMLARQTPILVHCAIQGGPDSISLRIIRGSGLVVLRHGHRLVGGREHAAVGDWLPPRRTWGSSPSARRRGWSGRSPDIVAYPGPLGADLRRPGAAAVGSTQVDPDALDDD